MRTEPRGELTRNVAAGRHPQMVLRLGHPRIIWSTSRRPPTEVLKHAPVAVQH
ncbi:hypothetical protein [Streptomyces griseorubiginosus]|uniref:hypothetical protein n=1 Tax=Streptomyces griseorubiginosus TaxID=67304 RepID=UPI001AD66B35|nr:hypothetical protein [Streptomyces griseorubiginosus]MBO4257807.1 hypothetical protein [Streptomyces griseorubiginosus]